MQMFEQNLYIGNLISEVLSGISEFSFDFFNFIILTKVIIKQIKLVMPNKPVIIESVIFLTSLEVLA